MKNGYLNFSRVPHLAEKENRESLRQGSSEENRPFYAERKKEKRQFENLWFSLFVFIAGGLMIGVQTTLVARISLFGLPPATPSLGLLFVGAVGFRHSEKEGALTGMFIGWISEATGGGGMIIKPLIYLLVGYAFGLLGRRKLAHNLPSFLVFSATAAAMEIGVEWGMSHLIQGGGGAVGALSQFVLTVMAAVPIYGLVILEGSPLKRKKSIDK